MSSSTSKSISNTNALSSARTSGRLRQSAGTQNRLCLGLRGLRSIAGTAVEACGGRESGAGNLHDGQLEIHGKA